MINALLTVILPLLLGAGCADPVRPDNLEPVIELLPVEGISRTGAVISARVLNRGQGALDCISFRYCEDGAMELTTQSPTGTDGALFTMELHGLKPGTTYAVYAEGGRGMAMVRSEVVRFTTLPNSIPMLSGVQSLSAGPAGVILEMGIAEDGGEPVLEAGCEVTEVLTGKRVRTYLADDKLTVGWHRLSVVGLTVDTRYLITPFASNSVGEAKGEPLDFTTPRSVVLDEAGVLGELFGGSAAVELEQLVISGYMNGDDFRCLRHLTGAPLLSGEVPVVSGVRDVDLADVHITGGGGAYDGSRFTVEGEVTTGLMADCSQLRNLVLPATATVVARDAVARCRLLETLTVPADAVQLMPSADCVMLSDIRISDGNRYFTSIDGVLFNGDATGILWFPLGKTGEYTLPPTITFIGENAFAGTRITGLRIPDSVTAIGREAFLDSSLSEIWLPDNLTNVSESIFQNCTALTTVHLGSATEFIGNYAFDGTGLTNLYVGAAIPPYVSAQGFVNRSASITDNCTLHVPAGSRAQYRNHSKWGLFSRIVEFQTTDSNE